MKLRTLVSRELFERKSQMLTCFLAIVRRKMVRLSGSYPQMTCTELRS